MWYEYRSKHFCTAFIVAISPVFVGHASEPQPEEKSVNELIQFLSSSRYAERESASKALQRRTGALLELRAAAKKADGESLRRLRQIVTAIESRRMARFIQYAKDGRLDVFIDWMALCEEPVDQMVYWQGVLDIGQDLVRRSRLIEVNQKRAVKNPYWMPEYFPKSFKDYLATFASNVPPHFLVNPKRLPRELPTVTTGVYFSRGQLPLGTDQASFSGSFIVNLAPVTLDNVTASIILCNDNVEVSTSGGCVIVTDGSFTSKYGGGDIVISRGDIHIKNMVVGDDALANGVYHTGGRMICEAIRHKGQNREKHHNDVCEEERRPLGFVRFFELLDVGLDVVEADAVVSVQKVHANTPPATAGLHAGDVILAVNGEKVTSIEELRREVRRGFARGAATLSMRRGDASRELLVSFLEWELPADTP